MDRVTKFENALIELIDMHMQDGLTGAEVRLVLTARKGDDFDASNRELMIPLLLPDQKEYLQKILDHQAEGYDRTAMVGGPNLPPYNK